MANGGNRGGNRGGQQRGGGNRPQGGQQNPQGGGGNQNQAAPKLFVSGTRDKVRVRITYFVNNVGQNVDFPLCFGPAGDPCAYGVPVPGTANPYTVQVRGGEGFVEGIDLTPYEHLDLKKVAVKMTGGREYPADLPAAQPNPAGATAIATASHAHGHHGPDDLYVIAEPVSNTHNTWNISGRVWSSGKPAAHGEVMISHSQGGGQHLHDGAFALNGIVVDKDTKVPVSVLSDPALSVDVQLVFEEPKSTTTTVTATTRTTTMPIIPAPTPKQHWWPRVNNHVARVLFLLGLWITLRTAQDLVQKVISPFSTVRSTVSGETIRTEGEKRKNRMQVYRDKLAGKQNTPAQQAQSSASKAFGMREQPGYGAEFLSTVFIVGPHDSGGFKREVICFLYWFPFFFPLVLFACFYDEVGRAGKKTVTAAARRQKGFTLSRARAEYRVRWVTHEGHRSLEKYLNGKLISDAATSASPASGSAEGKASGLKGFIKDTISFGKKDIMFEFLFKILGRFIPLFRGFVI